MGPIHHTAPSSDHYDSIQSVIQSQPPEKSQSLRIVFSRRTEPQQPSQHTLKIQAQLNSGYNYSFNFIQFSQIGPVAIIAEYLHIIQLISANSILSMSTAPVAKKQPKDCLSCRALESAVSQQSSVGRNPSRRAERPESIPMSCLQSMASSHELHLQILYRCMLYVRKGQERTLIDDGIMLEELSPHVTICSMPLPVSPIGHLLLKNGYVVVAYAVMMARLHASQLYYEYLMALFDNGYDIVHFHQEFVCYLHSGLDGVGLVFEQKSKKVTNITLKRPSLPQ